MALLVVHAGLSVAEAKAITLTEYRAIAKELEKKAPTL